MRKLIALVLGMLIAGLVGCGSSKTVNTAPLSDEQKVKIKAADQGLEDEERSGSGTATPVKKKKP